MTLSRRTDADGYGEVEIDSGFGHIVELTQPKPGGRNVYLKVKAEHLDKFPLAGQVDTRNAALWATVQELAASGGRLAYVLRIERKRHVDRTLPFDSVPGGATGERQREWESITPAGIGSAPPPVAARQVNGASRGGGVAVAERPTRYDDGDPGPTGPDDDPGESYQRPTGPPTTKDGRSAWAVDLAVEWMLAYYGGTEALAPEKVRALARKLLKARGEVVVATGLGEMAAATVIRTAARICPPPFGQPVPEQAAWVGELVAVAGRWATVVDEVDHP